MSLRNTRIDLFWDILVPLGIILIPTVFGWFGS